MKVYVRRLSLVVAILMVLPAGIAGAYETASVSSGATLAGKVTFKGKVPEPEVFEVEKNPEVCGKTRDLVTVSVKKGMLKDAVIYIKGIEKGKPFEIKEKGTDVTAKECQFFPFTGVVVRKSKFRVENFDSVIHNPHTYELIGKARRTLFNKPLPDVGAKISMKIMMKRGHVMKLECDQHNFMHNWFLRVKNPYYFVVGEDGRFSLDQIPPGRYKVIAWHPVLGTVEQEVDVKGKVTVNFEFQPK